MFLVSYLCFSSPLSEPSAFCPTPSKLLLLKTCFVLDNILINLHVSLKTISRLQYPVRLVQDQGKTFWFSENELS